MQIVLFSGDYVYLVNDIEPVNEVEEIDVTTLNEKEPRYITGIVEPKYRIGYQDIPIDLTEEQYKHIAIYNAECEVKKAKVEYERLLYKIDQAYERLSFIRKLKVRKKICKEKLNLVRMNTGRW